ncbi:MAG TPA: hypothetical protein DCS28_01485 [Candidatus Moranbacteria bacterium]|nr:hypothetical protein [Candidatus Moranbacteria bacterium]HAT74697.1 hypothetical protein [Candidatus Moranbacteria bacterium]
MRKSRKQISLDSLFGKRQKKLAPDYGLAKYILKNKHSSVLFSQKHGKKNNFTTNDSKLYFTQKELEKIRLGGTVNFITGKIDSVAYRQPPKARYALTVKKQDKLYLDIKEKYLSWEEYLKDAVSGYTHGISMSRMWNISLVTSLIFGMFLMTMIYRYLGQGARAQEAKDKAETQQLTKEQQAEKVLGENIAKEEVNKQTTDEAEKKSAENIAEKKQQGFELKIKEMVKGYPIEKMAPYIAKEDPIVAAFFIAIAKKESSWGEHAPVLNGKDCYNYVGFRLKTEAMGSNGHSCFSNPKEGFEVTIKRVKDLIYNEDMTTAKKMVRPWKCGYDCSWDKKENVQKWVADVDYYLKQVMLWKI